MSREDVREALKRFFEEETGKKLAAFSDEARVVDDYGMDSMDMVSLIMQVESHFRIRLTHGELSEATTVGALIDLVSAKLAVTNYKPPLARTAA